MPPDYISVSARLVFMVSMHFHGISVELYGIQVECHGIPWNAMDVMLFPGISVEFYGIQVECHGIPWNAMDVMLFPWDPWDTEDWYSDKISEWL